MTQAPKSSGLRSWLNNRKQKRKEKEEQEKVSEPYILKIITFAVTLVSMALAMSFLPLFPQPLPILLAVLVAFVTFRSPRFGMPIGGAIIGLGLLYHLAELYFISALGSTFARVVFVVALMTLFVGLPVFFNRYRSALAVDLGILAAVTLFSGSIFFLAIPLILASAVYFKKYVSLTAIYYVLISAPLMIVQYFEYTVEPIVRPDWWNTPGSAPPIFVSLSSIFTDISTSIGQFRLYDTLQFVSAIGGQLTWVPNFAGRTVKDAVSQYLDSLPGIILFVVIVVGLSLAIIFFARLMIKGGLVDFDNKLFPCLTATIVGALFFILLGSLQSALAFTADASATALVGGTLATLLFTIPVAFVEYTPKQSATTPEITEKAQALMKRLQVFEEQLNNVKKNIPVDVSSPEGKMLVIKDSLEDTLTKSTKHLFEASELDQKFAELDKLGKDLDGLESELDTILSEYQIFSNCEFSDWIGKLKEVGLDFKSTVNVEYQKEVTLDARTEAIKQVLDGGRVLAKDVTEVANPIYAVIRSLYDPSLPEQSRAVEFTLERIGEKEAPWIAIEALYTSLNNWKKQYGGEILASMKYLKSSLAPIANLDSQSEVLPPIFGNSLPTVVDYAKKAEAMKETIDQKVEKDQLNILDVIKLKDDIQSFLNIAKDVLSMLYAKLVGEEETIDRLLPTEEYLWEENSNLRERLKKATVTLSNPSNYQINQIMENLPNFLSYVDEAVQTLAVYNDRIEFLLNYPTAQAAIEEILKQKKQLTPQDLPFQTKFAGEYLRLYYTQRFGEFNFDRDNKLLTKKV